MPSKGKNVSIAGTETDPNINFTFADLQAELRRLHTETHPERQEGEFTIAEYASANGLTDTKAGSALNYLASIGKVEKCGNRYIDSRMRVVYRSVITTKAEK